MKRRQFIQKSALAAAALAMPWGKIKAGPVYCSTSFQAYKWINEKMDSYKINIDVCRESITAFEKAEASRKIFKLLINQNTKDEKMNITIKEYAAEIKITSVKKVAGKADYNVETELLQENKKEFELPKELNVKKLSFVFHDILGYCTIDVLDKKGNIYLNITEKPLIPPSDDDDYDDCFLTTACVNILGKPDDCFELTTLRKLRDKHMKTNEQGIKLIKEYYDIAPNIVQAIAVRSDRHTIYTDIYNQMILPTVHCVEKNDITGAISIYKNYTWKLKEQYL